MPKEFNPDEYLAKVDRSREASIEQPQTPDVSQLESIARGGVQGLSFGFADEATARLESLLTGKSYDQALQESRANYQKAQEANPITYTLGEIGGAVAPTIASAFIPGGQAGTAVGAANIATKAPTLLRLAGMGAGQGALSGLGYSEGQNASEIAEDVATGGAMGGLMGGVVGKATPKAGELLTKAGQSIKTTTPEAAEYLTKKGLTGFTRKSEKFLEELEKNPKAIERIETKFGGDLQKEILPEINEKIYKIAQENPFAKKASSGSRKSIESIPDDYTINKSEAISLLENELKKLSAESISDTGISAKSKIGQYLERLKLMGQKDVVEDIPTTDFFGMPKIEKKLVTKKSDTVNGKDIKLLLQNLGEDADSYGAYGLNPNSKIGKVVKDLRATFDKQIKSDLPEYKKIMEDVDKNTRASQRIIKTFMDKEKIDENKIANFTKRLVDNEQKLKQRQTKQTLDLLEQFRDTKTLGQDLSDLNLKKAIEARSNQGSNIATPTTMAFGAMGSGLGGLVGGFGGAGIGGAVGSGVGQMVSAQLEQKGGQIAKKVLDKTKNIRTPYTGQYTNPLQNLSDQSLQNITSKTTRGGTALLNDFLSQQRSEVNRKKAMQERGASR